VFQHHNYQQLLHCKQYYLRIYLLLFLSTYFYILHLYYLTIIVFIL
jgi:hypothetical protein